MNTITINVTMPSGLMETIKQLVRQGNYTSISEVIRDGVRRLTQPSQFTVNGFTSQFENKVIQSSQEPIKQSPQWNQKKSFVDFSLKHGQN